MYCQFCLSFGTAPISIGHLSCQFEFNLSFWGRTYIDRSFPCQFEFLGQYLYWSIIHLVFNLNFGTAPISINHLLVSLSLSFQFGITPLSICHRLVNLSLGFGTAPISISHCLVSLSLSFWNRTYIDWSLSCQFEFDFLGLHLYRLVIHLVRSIFCITPILIGHLSCQFEFSLSFWDHTYIDRPSSCQFVFNSSWGRTYIDRSSSCQFVFSLSWDHTYINRSSSCQFEIGFWGRTYINQPSSYQFVFSLSLGCTYIDRSSSCQFRFEFQNRIYIDRSFFLLVWVFETASISIGHFHVNLSFWDHIYIDWSSSCQFEFVFFGSHLYRLIIFLFVFSLSFRDRTYIDRPFILSV